MDGKQLKQDAALRNYANAIRAGGCIRERGLGLRENKGSEIGRGREENRGEEAEAQPGERRNRR